MINQGHRILWHTIIRRLFHSRHRLSNVLITQHSLVILNFCLMAGVTQDVARGRENGCVKAVDIFYEWLSGHCDDSLSLSLKAPRKWSLQWELHLPKMYYIVANPCYARKSRGTEISGYHSFTSASAVQSGGGWLQSKVGLQLVSFRFLTAVTPFQESLQWRHPTHSPSTLRILKRSNFKQYNSCSFMVCMLSLNSCFSKL